MADAIRTYLDFNATAPLRPQARAAMLDALDRVGNPSSVHAEGRAARAVVEGAREAVASLAVARSRDVVFTSGATEAAAMALSPMVGREADRRPLDRLLVGATEHPCVLAGGSFPAEAVEFLPVRPDGRIDLAALEERLSRAAAGGERVMVALQAANNETGVVQPVEEAAGLVQAVGGILVCDAVQAAGRIDMAEATRGADIVILSSHKLGGPQGVGALAVRSCDVRLGRPLLAGGGQERGIRAGTENVAGIAGLGAAAREALRDREAEAGRLAALRDDVERRILSLAPLAAVFGAGAPRLPNTTLFAVPGMKAETALIAFDLDGVAVSSGAACSSGKVRRSHVLEAMGVEPAAASGAIRLSFGWSNGEDEVIRFADAFERRLRALCLVQDRAA